ncbi:hypothetical protein VCRA2122O12_200003 [Vibrio crassostreae]|nr:hypothetical protein VCRA2110O1_180092 [Vibrio crassostreae]CAK1818398.1 hypothetical protein VCRA2110O4_190003 [Vibrio crassostreae]CAK1842891.1 hypothetical protein VCRA2114E5_190093 [Vibrio crassostreae]CAK2669447.1 hypothetical protein VCRA2110O2_200003 [Vibrio crassostreae]CAK2816790.1 hypothetical protein VCRA2110O3_390003 [Vibrio crassostreae]
MKAIILWYAKHSPLPPLKNKKGLVNGDQAFSLDVVLLIPNSDL